MNIFYPHLRRYVLSQIYRQPPQLASSYVNIIYVQDLKWKHHHLTVSLSVSTMRLFSAQLQLIVLFFLILYNQ